MSLTRARLVTLLAAAALVVAVASAPAPAGAATSYTIRGAGFGHGVGLSQYGALGMAEDGRRYRGILAHYYRGTELGEAPTDRVRVLLAEGASVAEVSGASRIPGRRSLDPDRTYRLAAMRDGRVELRSSSGRLLGRYPAPAVVDGGADGVRLAGRAINGVEDGGYRGTLYLHPGSGGLTTVNHVGLEDYLRGVVPGEMPSSWPRDALKAQAVAARSYALATARTSGLFDQYPDTRSQVYKGTAGEQRPTDAAIAATAGQVLLHEGAVATTFFFSTSGGRTEANENSLGGAPLPYLRSVDDPADAISPHHRWTMSLTREQIEDKLGSLVEGRYLGVRVLARGDSPRVVRAEVVGTEGRRPTDGKTLRARLGLRDTWAFFGRIDTAAASAVAATRSPAAGRAPAGVLTGRVSPAPRGGSVTIEHRGRRGGWRRALRGHTDPAGAFRIAVEREGLYRVRAAGAAGPAVRVR